MKTLFLTLKSFSATGGIEKVCRVAGKAMYETAMETKEEFSMYSMHDPAGSNSRPYLPQKVFKGFNGERVKFIIQSTREGAKSSVVVLSHINLLLAGYLIKRLAPKTKLILIAHGIEVWGPLSSAKKKMLQRMDIIAPVSHFSKEKMKELFDMPEEKFQVINNCLDPFLPEAPGSDRRNVFRSNYGFADNDLVLMTLSRLSAKEKSKNYDKVLVAIQKLLPSFPRLKYLFVGKYEEEERDRLIALADSLGIAGCLVFTGFVADTDIGDYYNMSDVYIMPSEKEGFGISFIEAMYYNRPVIAGNRDGTTDALVNGRLGTLVNPRSQEEIIEAIQKVITNLEAFAPDRELLMEKFSYGVYKDNWKGLLERVA